jgi:hypothetical protein
MCCALCVVLINALNRTPLRTKAGQAASEAPLMRGQSSIFVQSKFSGCTKYLFISIVQHLERAHLSFVVLPVSFTLFLQAFLVYAFRTRFGRFQPLDIGEDHALYVQATKDQQYRFHTKR